MFSAADFPTSATALFSAYASFTAMMMLIRSVTNELLPGPVRSYLESLFNRFFLRPLSNQSTIIVDEHCGIGRNEVFDAAEIYLRCKINPNTDRFKVGKTSKQKNLSVSLEKGEEVADVFGDLDLKWRFVVETPNDHAPEKRFFELRFSKKSKDRVMEDYIPFVLAKSKEMRDDDKTVKLFTTDGPYDEEDGGGVWGSVHLDHPSTFETLAMEPETKAAIIGDLDRFVRRREYYKKVGKAWKRGYLLYGPPGTGKSSLIAAMANHLKFDVYDLELTSLYSNGELRRILLSTTNKSIIVIEDIDCSAEMHDRDANYGNGPSNTKLTLSGLLNFIDGLWSSCGDERIIVFTTNHKDRLDPALLRPGRMDMHIHMSYCTYSGFKLLASNYLDLHDDHHELFDEIKTLIEDVEVTPAQIAEELMKSEDIDVALGGVVDFLKQKKKEACEVLKEEKSDGDFSLEEQEEEEGMVEDMGKRGGRGVRRRGGFRSNRGRYRGRGMGRGVRGPHTEMSQFCCRYRRKHPGFLGQKLLQPPPWTHGYLPQSTRQLV